MLSNILTRSLRNNFKNTTLCLLPKRLSSDTSPAVASENAIKPEDDEGRSDELYRYIWIKCSAHDSTILDSYEKFLNMTAQHLNIEFVKTETPWRMIKRKTLLASRHVHKKYRVQYESRNYYRNMLFKNLTGSTADTFLEYIERNIPEGVFFMAEKHRLAELPFKLEKNVDK